MPASPAGAARKLSSAAPVLGGESILFILEHLATPRMRELRALLRAGLRRDTRREASVIAADVTRSAAARDEARNCVSAARTYTATCQEHARTCAEAARNAERSAVPLAAAARGRGRSPWRPRRPGRGAGMVSAPSVASLKCMLQ